MSVQRLLVPVCRAETVRPRLHAAIALAREFRAHIDVLHVRADPQESVPLLGEGVSGAMIEDLMAITDKESRARAAEVRTAVEEVRRSLDVPLVAALPAAGSERPTLAWHEVVGREDDETVRRAHLADLVVLGRPETAADEPTPTTLNAVLFESGRPLLVAPPALATLPLPALGRTVAVAWNDSAEATRALTAALPLLARAAVVVVLTAATESLPAATASAVVDYLALHGIAARVGTVGEDSGPVGASLLDAAMAAGADLLVMGAYTHGRLYELILGGVTRHVLDRAAIPLLMAH